MSPSLAASDLTTTVGTRTLCHRLNLDLEPGQFWALLGPNGSGKSTLLTTLAGLRPPAGGGVSLGGRPITGLRRRQIARQLGLLPQDSNDPFPASTLQTALAGRFPHQGLFSRETADDVTLAERALDRVGLSALVDRDVATLSGGERRRLAIATLLTQDPQVLLLDEPTNHLDLHHQVAVLDTLQGLAARGRTVLAALHDPSLAARWCDHALLLFGDGEWAAGTATEQLAEAPLSRLYQHPLRRVEGPAGPAFLPT